MLSKVAVLAFAAAAVAAPAAEEAGVYRIPLKRRSLTLPNGFVDTVAFLESVNATLNKYNAPALPSYSFSGLVTRANVPLTDQVTQNEDELYYGNVVVGSTNQQTFTVDFDTGSADFFVPGPSCGSAQGCVGSTKYNQDGTDEGNTTSIRYGSGNVTGENYFDTVTVGGLSASHTNVISLTTAQGFSTSASEGLMGMAFQTIAQSKQPPFFQNLISQGKVSTPAFSFYLGRAKSSTASKSELTLGGADTSKYTGSFTKIPVTVQGYWQVALQHFNVKGKSVGAKSGGPAAIDTGTTVIVVPTAALKLIFKKIPGSFPVNLGGGAKGYGYPCSSKVTPSIVFGGKPFAINPLDFNFGQLSTAFARTINDQSLIERLATPPSDSTDSTAATSCLAAIIGENVPSITDQSVYLSIVGDTFIKNWYSTFSLASPPSVSFAKSV